MEENADTQSICLICGDNASNYRFYGATGICYSCRMFFRRSVLNKQEENFKCKNMQGPCTIEKLNRNHCRKCRYEKCLSIGMLPYLVDSCKRVHECETSPSSSSTNSPLVDVAMVKYEPFNTTVIKENLSDIFYTVYNNSSISKDLYLLDSYVFQQIVEKKNDTIVVPKESMKISKLFFDFTFKELYQRIFPNFASERIILISDSVAFTLLSLSGALMTCFQDTNCMDQLESCMQLLSPSSWDFYRELHPQITRINAIDFMEMDCFKSPYAKNYEDEEFLNSSYSKMKELINGDGELAALFFLLAIFSPISLPLSKEETHQLKTFQKKSSFLLYEYLMSKVDSDNKCTLEKVSSLVSLLNDLNKCGKILTNELIYHDIESSTTNIDLIDVDLL